MTRRRGNNGGCARPCTRTLFASAAVISAGLQASRVPLPRPLPAYHPLPMRGSPGESQTARQPICTPLCLRLQSSCGMVVSLPSSRHPPLCLSPCYLCHMLPCTSSSTAFYLLSLRVAFRALCSLEGSLLLALPPDASTPGVTPAGRRDAILWPGLLCVYA